MREDASSFPENWNALEGGTQNQTRLIGKPVTGPLFTFAPAIDQFLKRTCLVIFSSVTP
jgi:hypothetical protein